MSKVVSAIRSRLLALALWAVAILVIVGLVSANRSAQARQMAALSSPDQKTRDAMVLSLVQSGHLIDALTNTQDPNSDADSPQNKQSVVIRKNAADSAVRLIGDPQVTTAQEMDTLFLLCKDANADVKTSAEGGLQKVGEQNDANLHDIVGRLKDGDPDIRAAAVAVLGKIGGDKGFGDKTARAVDQVILDPTSQDSAESALQAIGDPAVPYLSAHLDDPRMTIEFRQKIVDLLGAVGTVGTLKPLTQMAQGNPDQPSVRREAVVSLASIVLSLYTAAQKAAADPKAKPEDKQKAAAAFAQARQSEPILIAALNNTGADSQTRSQAALALGRIGSQAALAALVAALGDYDTRVQQAATAGAQEVGPPAVGPLTAALTRGDEPVRASAAEALGGIGSGPAIAALDAAFQNPATPASVRRSAAVGLGRSGSPAVIPTLVRALGDPDGDVQSAASDALLSPALAAVATPSLIATFQRPTPVPFNASQTLARMGNQAVPALEQAAQSPDAQTQTWAAVTLGQTDSKTPGIVEALTPLTNSANGGVKYAAQEAINRLSGS